MTHLILLPLFWLYGGLASHAHEMGVLPVATYDAQVVVYVAGLSDEALTRLAKQVGRDKNVSLEYSCTWSGIIVLKFSETSVGERADVITLARRQFSTVGIDTGVEFLHVHVEPRGTGKC